MSLCTIYDSSKTILICLLFLCISSWLFPSSNSEPVKKGTKIMKVAEETYPFNLSGISNYMFNIQNSNPSLYDTLLPDYELIKKKKQNADYLMYYGIGFGLGLAVSGLIFQLDDIKTNTSTKTTDMGFAGPLTETTTTYTTNKVYNYYLGITGVCVALASVILSSVSGPDEKDFQTFIDKNNKNNKDNPLRVDIACDPLFEKLRLELAYKF